MTIALYRAAPCLQSKADRDRSGCNRGAFIPRLKRVGFPALIIVKSKLRTKFHKWYWKDLRTDSGLDAV